MASITRVRRAQIRRNPDGSIKPNLVCDRDKVEIKPGDPYKWMDIKTGPRSSRKLVRCDNCPDWHVWEYKNSLDARIAQIQHEGAEAIAAAEDHDGVESALSDAAERIRELAEEKHESASNIEEGFGHETEQSGELNDIADQLEDWASDVENAEVPDDPDPEDAECEGCGGTGKAGGDNAEGNPTPKVDCEDCSGTGHPEEPTEEQVDDWRNEVEGISILEDSPV